MHLIFVVRYKPDERGKKEREREGREREMEECVTISNIDCLDPYVVPCDYELSERYRERERDRRGRECVCVLQVYFKTLTPHVHRLRGAGITI